MSPSNYKYKGLNSVRLSMRDMTVAKSVRLKFDNKFQGSISTSEFLLFRDPCYKAEQGKKLMIDRNRR